MHRLLISPIATPSPRILRRRKFLCSERSSYGGLYRQNQKLVLASAVAKIIIFKLMMITLLREILNQTFRRNGGLLTNSRSAKDNETSGIDA